MEKNFVEVKKFDLPEGIELSDVIGKIRDALGRSTAKTNKSLYLHGIYKKFIVARDMDDGNYYKMTMKYDKAANTVELGDPVEVRIAWVPTAAAVEKSDDLPSVDLIELPPMTLIVEDGEINTASRESIDLVAKSLIGKADAEPSSYVAVDGEVSLWRDLI